MPRPRKSFSKPQKKIGKQIVNQESEPVNKSFGKIDVSKALKLRIKNHLTYEEIAAHFGCSRQAIYEKLKTFVKYVENPEAIQAFEDNKAEILSSVEQVMISKILDEDKLQKASLNNVAYAFTQIHTANRLQRGQATSITDDVDSIIDRIERRYACAIDITPSSNDSN